MPTDTDKITFTLNGRPALAAPGSSVAAAVLANGLAALRRSVSGEPRAPLCGMGVCFECRVTIDGRPHQKACQVTVISGMVVSTDE